MNAFKGPNWLKLKTLPWLYKDLVNTFTGNNLFEIVVWTNLSTWGAASPGLGFSADILKEKLSMMLLIEFLSTCCFYGTKLLKEGTRKYETHSEFIIVDPVPWLGLVDSCEQHRRNISLLNNFHKHHRIRPIWTLLLLLFFLVQFGIIRLMFNLNFAKECHVCSLISCETLLEEGNYQS